MKQVDGEVDMAHTLTGLRAIHKSGEPSPHGSRRERCRNVIMHVTLDAQHATPLREALIRDCGDQPWTIRVAPLRNSNRLRLSLYLPKTEVSHAIQRVALLAPAAQVDRMLEIPDTPTDAWRNVMQAESRPSTDALREPDATAAETHTMAQLISQDHVLLGLDVSNREALFVQLGYFFERRCGLPAATITAGLAEREALGSTGLGQGVALPHGHIHGLRQPMAAYVRPVSPIPFDAPDQQPVSDIVILLVPQWGDSMHLHLLADVAQHFCDHHFREHLHTCVHAQAVCKLFIAYEALENTRRGDRTPNPSVVHPTFSPSSGKRRNS
jgi:PTS system nitrogen regulatory IIA component